VTCPISQELLDHPMTNAACKHSYSQKSIEAYLLSHQNSARPAGTPAHTSVLPTFSCQCPRCNKPVSLQTLSHDRAREREVAAYQKALQREQASGGGAAGAAASHSRKRGTVKEEDLTQQPGGGGEEDLASVQQQEGKRRRTGGGGGGGEREEKSPAKAHAR
jgi:hypothetical protein